MAVTKNPLIRNKILDQCFRNTGKRYFINDLIAECSKVLVEIDPHSRGISRRQILQDIAFMESNEGWTVELKRHRIDKRVFYRYADTSYSINNMPLNVVEINQMQSAIQILSQFNGMPQFEWMNELLPKLQQGLTLHQQKSVISFDSNPYLKGIEKLGELFNAINYEKVLQITYQDFNSDQSYDLVLHPYYLKQYNNRWFLFGFNPEKNKPDWNLALDRIISIEEVKARYLENTTIDWEEYFEDIVGVTKPIDAIVENINLHFIGPTGKYIASKPLHGSQKSKWLTEDLFEVSLDVMINYELERLILSYGNSIKVLSPNRLVDLIKKRLEDARKHYY
ncbi:putative DNA-binding transcriptional regulator YafY [Mucilaginibacter sp. UYP25]|uniref:helix-turn-helix transcriptional regulator n=1 Tax=unclassified Mucilaginibacter TaxID=2617802 RepID=UPI003399C84F